MLIDGFRRMRSQVELVLLLACFLVHMHPAAAFRVVGRHRVNGDGSVSYDMPGVWIEAEIHADAQGHVHALFSKVNESLAADYFVVWCNGNQQPGGAYNSTFNTTSWASGVVVPVKVCSGIRPTTVNSIVIFKSTEAQWNSIQPAPNYVTFHGFLEHEEMLGEKSKHSTKRKRIEFLGDSITAGFCNLCDDFGGIPNADSTESFAYSWANLICQHFGAECHTAAWSGYGMVDNCCGGQTLMSDIWRRTLATVPARNLSDPHGTTLENYYNFSESSFVPDAVVINLGTNDRLPWRPQNVEDFNRTYLDLVISTAKAYNRSSREQTHFFLACGPMSSAYCPNVDWVIKESISRGIPAHFLDQRGYLNTKGTACCGHPSATTDQKMAEAGIEFMRKTMGW